MDKEVRHIVFGICKPPKDLDQINSNNEKQL